MVSPSITQCPGVCAVCVATEALVVVVVFFMV
jgi:hypothetical protein